MPLDDEFPQSQQNSDPEFTEFSKSGKETRDKEEENQRELPFVKVDLCQLPMYQNNAEPESDVEDTQEEKEVEVESDGTLTDGTLSDLGSQTSRENTPKQEDGEEGQSSKSAKDEKKGTV